MAKIMVRNNPQAHGQCGSGETKASGGCSACESSVTHAAGRRETGNSKRMGL